LRDNSVARLSLAAVPIAAGLVLNSPARADTLVTYDPTGINGSSTSLSPVAATSISAAINPSYSAAVAASGLTPGGNQMVAITAGSASNNGDMYNGLVSEVNDGIGTGGAAGTSSLANDVTDAASYYTFTISPTQPLNISAIDLSGNFYTSSNTGYPTFVLESSLTGFGSATGAAGNVLAQFTISRDTNSPYTGNGLTVMTPAQGVADGAPNASDVASSYSGVTISPTDVVNLSGVPLFSNVAVPVEFRLYVYTAGSAGSLNGKYFGIGGSGSGDATSTDNAILVDGTLAGTPEPAAVGIAVVGAALLTLRRRRAEML
jgi:hypothetical protein